MKQRKILDIIIYCFVLLIVTSCSTKKNSFTSRSFHNLTSHYNGYWNARDKMNSAVNEMVNAGFDNYTTTLTVHYYDNQKEAQTLKPTLDKCIEKSFLMIRRHSMVFESDEKVKWIDDCYFLAGQCYFYEKDFNNARRIFQYILKTYDKSEIKYSAKLWLAMTYIQNKEYEKAVNLLDDLQKSVDNLETPTDIRKKLPIVYSDYYILQSKDSLAMKYLESALTLNKMNRKLRQRISFIMGQIYQEESQYPLAMSYYQKSTKGSNFNIVFNSRIRMAQCADINNTNAVIKSLQKMLKEDKNKKYKDQIYYALAEIAKRGGDTSKFISSLRLSVSSSSSNNYQKALSAYELADFYFSVKKYIESQPYYDTTVQFLPQDYKNYIEIKQKTTVLGDLVKNLLVVQNEDSLQRIAKMDEPQRMALINNIIDSIKEKARIDKELEMQRQRNYNNSVINQYENQQTQNKLGNTVSWYFYSSQTVSAGITDFKKKWGDRKLEDLWALKNKQSFSWDDTASMAVDTTAADTTQRVTDNTDPQFYLQDLPLTKEKIDASNVKIEDALYAAGFIAMDQLNDYHLSNDCFMELVNRFPETDHKLTSYIMIYLNCKETKDDVCMGDVSAKIIAEYPESDFAKLLKDPSYLIVMSDKLEASKQLYSDIYDAAQDRMYDLVSLYSDEGVSLKDKNYTSRFLYFSALSDLATKGEKDSVAIVKLNNIVTNYSKDDIAPIAQELLTYLIPKETKVQDSATLSKIEEAKQVEQKLQEEISQYKFVCNAQYFYVLLINTQKANAKAISTRVSDYLLRYHKLDNLSSVERVYNDTCEMITVSSFSDCNKALEFYNNAIINNYIFSSLANDAYYHFIISRDNYPVFYKNKNIDAYMYFFRKKILQEGK